MAREPLATEAAAVATKNPEQAPGGHRQPAARAIGVSKTYRRNDGSVLEALTPTSLDLFGSEFTTIIGPSGCGKSTFLQILGGLQEATTGKVMVGERCINGPAPREIGFVFQDYSLFPWRTLQENVELGLQFQGVGRRERREIATHCLARVGLRSFASYYPRQISGGMQQRVAVARALALDTPLLLMDEPFGALDEQTRGLLGEDLSRLTADTGKSIVFVTHSLSEAVLLSDRILVMSAQPGRVLQMIQVDEGHPRKSSFTKSPKFGKLRNQLFDLLRQEVLKATEKELGLEGFGQ